MSVDFESVIPLKWYIDPRATEAEKQFLLNADIYYLGHRSHVSKQGDFSVLATTFNGKIMVQNEDQIRVISNICRHRQAQLLEGKGNVRSIMCPVHHWRYDLKGTGLSAHHFENYTCPNLEQTPITNHCDFIFRESDSIKRILSKSEQFQKYAKEPYKVMSVEALHANYNWKIFMETYLDVYHIRSIHPGLRDFANCNDVEWELDDLYSSQSVAIYRDEAANPSANYKEYMHWINKLYPDREDLRITWFALYPNLMIEFYPFNMVTSLVLPVGPEETINVVEFLAHEELLARPDGIHMHEAFKRAYLETAAEDDLACRKIQGGRNNLYSLQMEDHGPYHDPLELGIPSFYQYWHEMMKHNLSSRDQSA